MQKESLKIGLACSGGGHRAACFTLGVLDYLHRLDSGEGPLLQSVIALSTVSGGTITGARYAMSAATGESFDVFYEKTYHFLTEVDLVSRWLDRLTDPKRKWEKGRNRGLITAAADVYDSELFQHQTLGPLLKDEPDFHLKHFSFNATEFAHALQFRFQWSEKIIKPDKDEPERGLIGNYYYRIPFSIASQIRLGDILASSSCFPGGFEPINFPNDFVLSEPERDMLHPFLKDDPLPVGLMDGGIVDNQGIEPILLAEDRMERNRNSLKGPDGGIDKVFDLIIVSDVASPFMENFVSSPPFAGHAFWKKLSLQQLLLINTILLIASFYGLFQSITNSLTFGIVTFSVLATINFSVYLLVKKAGSWFARMSVPKAFLKPLRKLLKLRIYVYESLLMNRVNSVLKLTSEVFLKHIRRLNYQKIFDDEGWKNRRIMNAIYELCRDIYVLKKKVKDGKLPAVLLPSEYIQQTARQASSMGTTLWFSLEEKISRMPEAIIAAGQFTMCWNLLEYIYKIRKCPVNTTMNHKIILDLEKILDEDWRKFQEDPFWMVNLRVSDK